MDTLQPINPTSDVNLHDVSRVFWRRKWLMFFIFLFCIGAAVIVTLVMKKRWQATAQMIVIQRPVTWASTPEASILAPVEETPDSQTAMILSDAMAQRTLDQLRNNELTSGLSRADLGIDDDEQFRQDFSRLVSADSPKETNVLLISGVGTSPQAALTLTNAVCQAFVAWKLDLAQQNVKAAMQALEDKVAVAKHQMDKAVDTQASYRQQHHIMDVDWGNRTASETLAARDNDVHLAEQDVASQEAKLKALAAQLKSANAAIASSDGIRDDAGLQAMQAALQKAEMDRQAAGLVYTYDFPGDDQNPSLAVLDARIKDLQQRIASAIKGILTNRQPNLISQSVLLDSYTQQQALTAVSQAHLAAAIKVRDDFKKSIADVPQTAMEYEKLQNNSALARNSYNTLKTDMDLLGNNANLVASNVQISQPAIVDQTPYRPSWLMNLAVGGILGIFLAVGSVLLLENNDRRVWDVESAKRLSPGPVIGALPKMKRRQIRELILGAGPPTALEAYGVARANLAFVLGSDPQIDVLQNRVIMVTSAVPGEGKSVTAAALARSMARSGKQVILVDADMRRPAQNKLFNTAEPHGLAEVLMGEMKLDDVVVASSTPNLAILHSGAAKRNPGDLLSMPQLGDTLAALRDQADMVIVDAPASVAVADALYISRHCDCILHVVGIGKVPEETFRESAETLEAASRKPIVFIVNRAPRGRQHAFRAYYAFDESRALSNGNGAHADLPAIPADQPPNKSNTSV